MSGKTRDSRWYENVEMGFGWVDDGRGGFWEGFVGYGVVEIGEVS